MVGPWIAFLPTAIAVVGAFYDMGDLEFLSIKEHENKRVDKDQSVSVTNTVTETDIWTQTANTGKDMWLDEISWTTFIASSGSFNITLRLFLNGVEVEKLHFETVNDAQELARVFKTTGVKVAAGQIIKLTIQHSSAGATRTTNNEVTGILWEEDTGDTPQIPPLNPV